MGEGAQLTRGRPDPGGLSGGGAARPGGPQHTQLQPPTSASGLRAPPTRSVPPGVGHTVTAITTASGPPARAGPSLAHGKEPGTQHSGDSKWDQGPLCSTAPAAPHRPRDHVPCPGAQSTVLGTTGKPDPGGVRAVRRLRPATLDRVPPVGHPGARGSFPPSFATSAISRQPHLRAKADVLCAILATVIFHSDTQKKERFIYILPSKEFERR